MTQEAFIKQAKQMLIPQSAWLKQDMSCMNCWPDGTAAHAAAHSRAALSSFMAG
jgi:hypothetical protein